MSYSLHRGASQDLQEAAAFYRREGGARLAKRFLDEFVRGATMLAKNPKFGTPTSDERRTYPFRVFPYSVIYKPDESGIRILVVRHQNRDPDLGVRRT